MITVDHDEPAPTIPELERQLAAATQSIRFLTQYRRALKAELAEARELATYAPPHPTAHPQR